jgi:hypothetical protein
MKKPLFFLLLLSFALLQGCGVHMRNPPDPSASLVFGYMDMNDAPTGLTYATVKQYKPKPKDDKPYWYASTVDGIFWFEQLLPGSYQLVYFGGHSWWRNAKYDYYMPEFKKNDTAVVIKKPGIYFLGSYKYKDAGSFFNPKFEVEKMNRPTELELLTKLLPYSSGTQWEAMIKKRMEQLR